METFSQPRMEWNQTKLQTPSSKKFLLTNTAMTSLLWEYNSEFMTVTGQGAITFTKPPISTANMLRQYVNNYEPKHVHSPRLM